MNEVRCNLIVIRSHDLENAAAFYSALGLWLNKYRHGDGPEHYASESDGQVFEIYPLSLDAQPTTTTRLGFAVQDVDQVYERLMAIGAQHVSAPKQSPWGRRAVLSDFDVHRIELTGQ